MSSNNKCPKIVDHCTPIGIRARLDHILSSPIAIRANSKPTLPPHQGRIPQPHGFTTDTSEPSPSKLSTTTPSCLVSASALLLSLHNSNWIVAVTATAWRQYGCLSCVMVDLLSRPCSETTHV